MIPNEHRQILHTACRVIKPYRASTHQQIPNIRSEIDGGRWGI